MRLTTLARTLHSLGWRNVARVACYRLTLRLGLHPAQRLAASAPSGPFFRAALAPALPLPASPPPALPLPGVGAWRETALLFGRWPFAVGAQAPNWLANPLTGQALPGAQRPWWRIPDFDPAVGDIKLVWELSRMDWVLAYAQGARHGDAAALARLNAWLADWCAHNPPYQGPNWKCAQEASIRVLHLSMAALMLDQIDTPTEGLQALLHLHLQRIAPTVSYALAQDNNHGTSEAAALFIGGTWLASQGSPEGRAWAHSGRHWLEERTQRLIAPDGSFSQYSLNYHRLLLDTLCMAEVWRRRLGAPAFSAPWTARAQAATQWLWHLVEPGHGDAPNVGANDGARLLQLTDTPYRDHRPSVQLAMALFHGQRAYAPPGPWNLALQWLGVALPPTVADAPGSRIADDGGFAVLRRGPTLALLRYPRFRFRPSQADALHLDLWREGENLLRDAGSYSYHTEPRWLRYFGGTAGHNTVQFDGRDQMPRLGRFLFGDWLQTSQIEPLRQDPRGVHFAAGYRDRHGARHHRRISLHDTHLRVVDEVAHFTRKAVLRWRLAPGPWQVQDQGPDQGHGVSNGVHRLTVHSTAPVLRCELVEGWESRHYLEKTPLPVLEVEIAQAATLTSDYHWHA